VKIVLKGKERRKSSCRGAKQLLTFCAMPDHIVAGSAFTRRKFLRTTSLSGLAAFWLKSNFLANAADTLTLPFANGERKLATFPQKRPLILLSSRPPQLETPFSVFNEGVITPNDAFFVRYHLAQIPTSIDPEKFRVSIKGKVNSPLDLSLADLKKFEAVELVAAAAVKFQRLFQWRMS